MTGGPTGGQVESKLGEVMLWMGVMVAVSEAEKK
jgi:hypothetical protein